ncbi:MAG: glutamate racemase [Dehalococcoidia bacterium]|nr:glutamate racemase [Dehalococcoidia bacterium]
MLARVGIFDSGVGGLTVAAALHRHQPSLEIRYVADTAFFPYGSREPEEIAERSIAVVATLVEAGMNAIVVACNTATSAALERLREVFDVPIVGMEPPLKPAVEHSRSGTVVVLATPGTVRGDRLARLQERHAGGARVWNIPMPGLADLVEAGEIEGPRVEGMLREALAGPIAEGADAVALGCTHYGWLRPLLERILPPGVELVDAAEAVARRTLYVLDQAGHHIDMRAPAREVLCYATGDAASLEQTVERLRAAGADLPPLRVAKPVG